MSDFDANFNWKITRDPFTYFHADDVFSDEMFAALKRDWPVKHIGSDATALAHNAGKLAFNSTNESFDDAVAGTAYEDLIRFYKSPAFTDAVSSVFGADLNRHHPDISGIEWTEDNLDFNFQFSQMLPGSYMHPHCDNEQKVAVFILYVPDENWGPDDKGGTSFHNVNKPEAYIDYRNIYYPFDVAPAVATADYVPNRIAGFIKNERSYHAVQPIECSNGTARRAFIFNISKKTAPKRRKVAFKLAEMSGKLMSRAG